MNYVDGYMLAVSTDKKEEYIEFATMAAKILKEHGALSVVESWGDDVPDGKLTSMPLAVKREENETVVMAWITWESKEARDASWEKIMADERLHVPTPFDGKRMIFGGFSPIVSL